MQKIALVSDIHGNYLALEAVAANIAQRAITKVINLGDHVSGPLWPQKTIDFLRQSDWVHIRGNHDRVLAFGNPETHGPSDRYAFLELTTDDLSWLPPCPQRLSVKTASGPFMGGHRVIRIIYWKLFIPGLQPWLRKLKSYPGWGRTQNGA